MKNIIIKKIKRYFCAGCSILVLLSFGSCSTQSDDSSVTSGMPVDSNTVTNFTPSAPLAFLPPYLLSADRHLNLLLDAGCLSDSWTSPDKLSPDCMVTFYKALSEIDSRVPSRVSDAPNHPKYGVSTIYEIYVEDVAAKYFGVDSDFMQKSSYYHAPGKGYALGELNSVDTCTAQNITLESDGITITFDMFRKGEPYATGELAIKMLGDKCHYRSLILNKDKRPSEIGLPSLDDLCSQYVTPLMPTGGILISSWNNPGEIDANDLISFCAYNNLLQRETTDPNKTIAMGGEYIDPYADAVEVETAIKQYFDTSTDHLRSANAYEHEGHSGKYLLGHGYGGSGRVQALEYEREGDLLHIRVAILGGESTLMPSLTGMLTVETSSSGFKYLSYGLEKAV